MKEKTKKILEKLKDKLIGIFVDDSNLYHSYKRFGWRIDMTKLQQVFAEEIEYKKKPCNQ